MDSKPISIKIYNRLISTRLNKWFEDRYRSLNNYNLYWVMVWSIDYICNLKCIYCGNANVIVSSSDKDSRRRALEIIKKYKPGYLVISGGEPTKIPDLVENIRYLHDNLPDTDILLITSLITENFSFYYKIIPHLHDMMVSLDGLDEINKIQRGVDGKIIIEGITELWPFLEKNDVGLCINSVITIYNYDKIGFLFRELNNISPKIKLTVSPVFPLDQKISIYRDKSKLKKFIELYNDLKNKYGERRLDMNGFFNKSINCYAQFLNAFIDPRANLNICSKKKFNGDFNIIFFIHYILNNWYCDSKNIIIFLKDFILGRSSSICFSPCNTSFKLNELIARHPSLRKAIFFDNSSIRDCILGSLTFFKYDFLFRRNFLRKFFTMNSNNFFCRYLTFELIDKFYNRFDYNRVFFVDCLDLEKFEFDTETIETNQIKCRVWFRKRKKEYRNFPHYHLYLQNNSWKIDLEKLFAQI